MWRRCVWASLILPVGKMFGTQPPTSERAAARTMAPCCRRVSVPLVTSCVGDRFDVPDEPGVVGVVGVLGDQVVDRAAVAGVDVGRYRCRHRG